MHTYAGDDDVEASSEGGVANVRFDVSPIHKSQVDGFANIGGCEDNDIWIPLQTIQLRQEGIHCGHKR